MPAHNGGEHIAVSFEIRRNTRQLSDENLAPTGPLAVVSEPVNTCLHAAADRPFGNDVHATVAVCIEGEHAVHSGRQVKTGPVRRQVTRIPVPVPARYDVGASVAVAIAEIQSNSRGGTNPVDLDVM